MSNVRQLGAQSCPLCAMAEHGFTLPASGAAKAIEDGARPHLCEPCARMIDLVLLPGNERAGFIFQKRG